MKLNKIDLQPRGGCKVCENMFGLICEYSEREGHERNQPKESEPCRCVAAPVCT